MSNPTYIMSVISEVESASLRAETKGMEMSQLATVLRIAEGGTLNIIGKFIVSDINVVDHIIYAYDVFDFEAKPGDILVVPSNGAPKIEGYPDQCRSVYTLSKNHERYPGLGNEFPDQIILFGTNQEAENVAEQLSNLYSGCDELFVVRPYEGELDLPISDLKLMRIWLQHIKEKIA